MANLLTINPDTTKMKSIITRILTALTALILISTSTSAQEEELIFKERFTNLSGNNADIADFGWKAYILDPRTDSFALDVSTQDNQPHASHAGVGRETGFEECFCDDDLGLLFQWNGNRDTWFAMIYEDITVDRSQMEISRVTWADLSGSPDQPYDHAVHFIVRIAGQWYATATGYDPHEEGHGDQWAVSEHTFTTAESDWLHLTLDPGTALELGTNVAGGLPEGNIDGVGFYFFHPAFDPHASIRVDELEIYAKTAEVDPTDTWGPYTIVKQGDRDWVDTSPWMGWLDVTSSPWNYSLSLDGWVYTDGENASSDAGAWVYVLK